MVAGFAIGDALYAKLTSSENLLIAAIGLAILVWIKRKA
jgi:hypothetical protein